MAMSVLSMARHVAGDLRDGLAGSGVRSAARGVRRLLGVDFVGLAALTDIFFGRIIHVRKRMVPFGTVSLTSYFHAADADLAELGSTPVLGTADARIFDRGFHDQSAELWSADGRLLATSHQLVYYRDPAA